MYYNPIYLDSWLSKLAVDPCTVRKIRTYIRERGFRRRAKSSGAFDRGLRRKENTNDMH